MTEPKSTQINEFITSFKGLLEQVATQSDKEVSSFYTRLQTFFQTDPRKLPIVSQEFGKSDHINLHLAIEEFIKSKGLQSDLIGVVSPSEYRSLKLSNLITPPSRGLMGQNQPAEGPVEYKNIPADRGEVLTCVQTGLYLLENKDNKFVLFLQGPEETFFRRKIDLEVMAPSRKQAEDFLTDIRTIIRKKNIYRGRIISIQYNQRRGDYDIHFHKLPTISRNAIILPKGILERVERHTIRFTQLSDKLRSTNRHLKRGILLHGPPGTGKTLTAMYLASQMKERTTILLTGPNVGTIWKSCQMARMLEPATIILEDVDLIAEERTRQDTCSNSLLFELLNQMDGLAEDADILFLLTTNRPEILEPALASRPGRIDQALEIPLPDAECRKLIFELYSKGLQIQVKDWTKIIHRTENVSPAFIKELMRKAALLAADENNEFILFDKHIDQALRELIMDGGELTKRLLGVGKSFDSSN